MEHELKVTLYRYDYNDIVKIHYWRYLFHFIAAVIEGKFARLWLGPTEPYAKGTIIN